MPSPPITAEEFVKRAASIRCQSDLDSLRNDAVSTENLYRELFARSRESWEIPEVDDPYLFLVDAFHQFSSSGKEEDVDGDRGMNANTEVFRRLPKYSDDCVPRCFDLGSKRKNSGSDAIVSTKLEFDVSWDCFTEGLLRFLNWDNVIAAGGSVAGCLSALPPDVRIPPRTDGGPSATRVARRKYFHDVFLPGSDVDLFLYGLDEKKAEKKLLEIYDAVQAANPYEVRAFRSSHAITLVSRYPFRHVQIVLRLYNSPAEVLMGFDVDACAVGYDGQRVVACPRAVLSIMTQSNSVDMTRRSPSYEMRLAKYASRGFEIIVPTLDRDRIDPFLYEKRFDQTRGLARLLLLERLRTPEERLRYRIEGQLKRGAGRNVPGVGNEWRFRMKMQKAMRDKRNLERIEGTEGVLPPHTGAESSDYSTVFLPWGPEWTADRIERLTKKKDKILNKTEFLPDGRVVASRRPYKIHVCAVGTMAEMIENPFPDDPPIPDDVSPEALESCVRDRLSWLVDNPGRQQIGSFHPITEGDWTEGAYISRDTEALIASTLANDVDELLVCLSREKEKDDHAATSAALLHTRDFLGRSVLHVAALGGAGKSCKVLLDHPAADAELLQGRLADGRTALHLAAMRGDQRIVSLILEKRKQLAQAAVSGSGDMDEAAAAVEVLDVDGSDWEVKLNALQYAIAFGHAGVVQTLINCGGANARKIAVHKDRNEGLSSLSLLAFHASESAWTRAGGRGDANTVSLVKGDVDIDGECNAGGDPVEHIFNALVEAGASPAQVDTSGCTCWHTLASDLRPSSCDTLEMFLEGDATPDATIPPGGQKPESRPGGKARALDVLAPGLQTALYVATECGNARAVRSLLRAGATAVFDEDDWAVRVRRLNEAAAATAAAGMGGRVRQVARFNHRSRHFMGCGQGGALSVPPEEFLRCPIMLAVQNADVSCIEAYLSHDATLANTIIRVTKTNAPQVHGDAVDNTQAARPLDLLEQLRESATGGSDFPHKKQIEPPRAVELRVGVESAATRFNKARVERDKSAEGTYEHTLWALVTCREKQNLDVAEEQVKNSELNEEDERDESEALKNIDAAHRMIQDAGGVKHPGKEDEEEKEQGMERQDPSHTQRLGQSRMLQQQTLADPFLRFFTLPPLDFVSAMHASSQNGRYRGRGGTQFELLSRTEQSIAVELMVACTRKDSDAIRAASCRVRVCVVDCMGTTPLFAAVKAGGTGDLLRVVYEAGRRQHELHEERREALRKAQEEAEASKPVSGRANGTEAENVVRDQLRRLNNLDIAAGETPRNTTLTPDQMRLRLEAAEAAALGQEKQGEKTRGDGNAEDACGDIPSSPVSAQVLLLHRSIVLTESEQSLSDLRKKMAMEQPDSFPSTSTTDPVRLRPIELAVIRGDLALVDALLGLVDAQAGGDANKPEGRDANTADGRLEQKTSATSEDKESEGKDECTSEDDENGMMLSEDEKECCDSEVCSEEEEVYYDDDFVDGVVPANGRRGREMESQSMSASQLRWLLAGDGSRNHDLGGMTLLQLAVAGDHPDIFRAIASYAAEHGLPLGAVALWKRDLESREDETVDKDTQEKREKETNEIAGEGCQYYPYNVGKLPLWSGTGTRGGGVIAASQNPGENSVSVYPTPLQFALSVGASKVAREIMSGRADDALLGWILSTNAMPPKSVCPRGGAVSRQGVNISEGHALAGRWLISLPFKLDSGHHGRVESGGSGGGGMTRAELARRLVRPTALDGAGRTALFYAPADDIPAVVDAAVRAIDKAATDEGETNMNDAKHTDARTSFLETCSTLGSVTALMAAASAGEVERVRALLNVGCARSKTLGPKGWGPLHLAIPPKVQFTPQYQQRKYYYEMNLASEEADEEELTRATIHNQRQRHWLPPKGVDGETWRWARAREVIQLILDGATEDEAREALLSPGSEHTPLMLAADRGADEPTISLLLKSTANSCPRQRNVSDTDSALLVKDEGVGRRDGELNTVLHLAVGVALEGGGNNCGGDHCRQSRLDSVAALLKPTSDADVVTGSVPGPGVENARGTTPHELALESMASVWGRGVGRPMRAHEEHRAQLQQQRRAMLGKGPLPRTPKNESAKIREEKGEDENANEASMARQALKILEGSGGDWDGPKEVRRVPVSLEEVQEAKKRATERTAEASKQSIMNFGGPRHPRGKDEKYQSEPSGRPVVLAHNQQNHFNHFGGRSARQHWNGWPMP